jgi:glucose-6-phosphate 1-dehydrogenase
MRAEKLRLFRAVRPLDPRHVVRGQFRGYRNEPGVAPDSQVETFAALCLHIDTWRWAGVPFYLRTGKRMPRRSAEIVIEFKSLPGVLYYAQKPPIQPNLLVIKVQPEEGIAVQFNIKGMGARYGVAPVQMDFCQNCQFPDRSPEAYERLIADAIEGDTTLFTRWDEVACQWRFVDRIAEAWADEPSEVPNYLPGSWGPAAADELLHRDGRHWHTPLPTTRVCKLL